MELNNIITDNKVKHNISKNDKVRKLTTGKQIQEAFLKRPTRDLFYDRPDGDDGQLIRKKGDKIPKGSDVQKKRYKGVPSWKCFDGD